MKNKKPVLDNSIFACYHLELSVETNNDINSFQTDTLNGKGVLEYLQQNAIKEENSNFARTYLVYDKFTDELAAFFTLKAGMVLRTDEIDPDYVIPRDLGDSFESCPGIELAYLGVNASYKKNHPDIQYGVMIFTEFIYVIAKQVASLIGAHIIYGFSVDNNRLLSHYIEKYGFSRLSPEYEEELHKKFRPYVDDRCTFVYQRLDLD